MSVTATNPTQAAGGDVELASGKDKGDENFPVGSWLIRRDLRRHVHAYYAFARNADDIADHPTLTPDDKIARLDVMEAVLTGAADHGSTSALRLRASLAETGVDPVHATELLIAFRQDATKRRYATWAELMHYCRYSAAPVGRYVLALHGENTASWPASDALCASLQVLNHIQDCAKDFAELDRSYLPDDWLTREGLTAAAVTDPATSPALRRVFDAMLAATADLNRAATPLPGHVRARGLRVETAIILALARRLHARLSRQDPLAMRVKLRPADAAAALLAGLTRTLG
ncbi:MULTISPECIES: squalene synthase HpnC [Acidiphilium]|uniref:Farnesyl-diphosphate farnesyltransferase n=1 Tax=Acidiphilium rubrum TaxID=526 RepID=A0A8G2CJA5_ACIRU|nr:MULTISPECIES: squalene synthase HpnC [Acidiphilium]SIQ47721.1 farnesyl-diphosphate farnesyltransferase [Acidiphilium rubrum]